MSARSVSEVEGFKFIRDRLATREWWLIPVTNIESARLVADIAERHYAGDKAELLDVVMILNPVPNLPVLSLVLAFKGCMSPAQISELSGTPIGDGSRDVLLHPQTPLSVVLWLAERFREEPTAGGKTRD